MRVVVADTSPINYLVQLSCVDVLRQLFGRVERPPGEVTLAIPEEAGQVVCRKLRRKLMETTGCD
jgi:hypothetical protein